MVAKLRSQLQLAEDVHKVQKEKSFSTDKLLPPGDLSQRIRSLIPTYYEMSSPTQKYMDVLDTFVEGPKKVAVKAAAATGLGLAMKKLVSKISKADIWDELLHAKDIGTKNTARDFVFNDASGMFWSDVYTESLKDPKLRGELARVMRMFPEEYLNAPATRGRALREFVTAPENPDRLGHYVPAKQRIELNTFPKGQDIKRLPGTFGHELEHWWGDFIKDQTGRRLTKKFGTDVMFSDEQFGRLEDVFARLLVDIKQDPKMPLEMLGELGMKFSDTAGLYKAMESVANAKKFLSSESNLAKMADFYKHHGFPTEHASRGFEKALKGPGGGRPFDSHTTGYPEYGTTKAFTRATVGLRDVAFHHKIEDQILTEGFRRATGKASKSYDFGDAANRWYKKQTPDVKKRMVKRWKTVIEEAEARGMMKK